MTEFSTRGDMTVVGAPDAKLTKALAVIADGLHPGFDLYSKIVPGKSKRSCVLCALTVRDFLTRIGFAGADVRPVAVVLWAVQDGKELHSLGVGAAGPPGRKLAPGDDWAGHLVTTVGNYVIDTTLYRAARPHWPHLSGMMALPVLPQWREHKIMGLDVFTGLIIGDPERPGYEFNMAWLDNPSNLRWRIGPDAREPKRRASVVERLVERFEELEEAAA